MAEDKMTKDVYCCGVPHYFQPHQTPKEEAFIRDSLHYCLPCFYLSLALRGDSEQANKVLSGDIPRIPIAIDDFVLP
jgi:hypothetical protein